MDEHKKLATQVFSKMKVLEQLVNEKVSKKIIFSPWPGQGNR